MNSNTPPLSAGPKVSLVVPARNEEQMIGGCIASLKLQCRDLTCEIIVVDNGSSDRTAERAASHGARVVFEGTPGLANARQAGLEASRGEIIIYVDADTRLPPNGAREIADLFDSTPDMVGLSPAFDFHDGRAIDNAGNFIFRSLLCPAVNGLLGLVGHPDILIGSTIAARAEALRRANGVDPGFQFYGEDTMLARRLHSQGEVRFVRSPRLSTSARRYQERGILTVVYRYFLVFALIHLGLIELAKRAANRFQASDRGPGRRPQYRESGMSTERIEGRIEAVHAGEVLPASEGRFDAEREIARIP